MTARALVVLVALGCCSRPGWAADAEGLLTGYSLTSWNDGNGRPLGSVYTIAQGPDGYLWIGADAGLFRFDGWQFTSWDALSATDLPASAVTALWITQGGTIWAGFDGAGIYRISKGSTQLENSRETGPNSVSQIVEDQGGTLWAIGSGGLYRRRGQSWERMELPLPPLLQPGLAGRLPSDIAGGVLQLYVGRRGDLWLGTRWGVLRRDQRGERFDKISEGFVWGISEDSAGAVWTTDVLSGFRRLGSTTGPHHGLQGAGYRLLHDRSGHLWVATFGKGLWLVRGNPTGSAFTVERAGVSTGLSTDSILALLEDHVGNIWVGTTAGLHRLRRRELAAVEGLRDVIVLEAAPGGFVWAGTSDGLMQLGRETVVPCQEIGLCGHDVRALYDDRNGSLWVGTEAGLWRLFDGRLSPVKIPGKSGMPIFSIAPDQKGGVWLGDGIGLFRWNGSNLASLERVPSELGRIAVARSDSSGRLWVGFLNGHIGVREPDGTFRVVGERDGLNSRTHDAIYTIFEGRTGDLWFGGSGGLTRLTGGRFTTVGPEQGMPAGGVRAVTEDDDGDLWLNMDHGLLRIRRDEFVKAAATPSYRVRYRRYDALDGVAGPPIGMLGSVRTNDGKLWFVRGGGLTLVEPARLKQEPAEVSTIRIESVVADERRLLSPASRMSFAPGTTRLEINYTALALTASHKIRFRYRLEAVDPDWIDAGTRRSASYTNLAPGNYRFRVEAMAADDRRDSGATAWDFTVQPAYYQTAWFSVLCVCLVVTAIWWALRLRVAFIQQQFSLALAERARLSRELHDTLLQSLVGVTLQLGALADAIGSKPSWTRDQLTRIRRHVEAYIEEAEQSILDLRSPSLAKKDLLAALNSFGAETVAPYDIRFDPAPTSPLPQCPPKVEAQLLRIGHEAITNAVRHAKASRIRLDVTSDGSLVTLRVSDDGCGFDVGSPPTDTQHHFGLLTMKERAEEVGGRLVIMSGPNGTTVEAVVPLSIRNRVFVGA